MIRFQQEQNSLGTTMKALAFGPETEYKAKGREQTPGMRDYGAPSGEKRSIPEIRTKPQHF